MTIPENISKKDVMKATCDRNYCSDKLTEQPKRQTKHIQRYFREMFYHDRKQGNKRRAGN